MAIASLNKLTEILGPKALKEAPEGFMNAVEIAKEWGCCNATARVKLKASDLERVQVNQTTYYKVL